MGKNTIRQIIVKHSVAALQASRSQLIGGIEVLRKW